MSKIIRKITQKNTNHLLGFFLELFSKYTTPSRLCKKRNSHEKLQILEALNVYVHISQPLLWSVTSQISSMLKTGTPKTGGNSIFWPGEENYTQVRLSTHCNCKEEGGHYVGRERHRKEYTLQPDISDQVSNIDSIQCTITYIWKRCLNTNILNQVMCDISLLYSATLMNSISHLTLKAKLTRWVSSFVSSTWRCAEEKLLSKLELFRQKHILGGEGVWNTVFFSLQTATRMVANSNGNAYLKSK